MSEEIERIIKLCSCGDTFDYVITPIQRDTMKLVEYIKQLQQENQQLKEEIREEKLNYARLQNTLIESNEDRIKMQSVLDEIRECIDNFPCIHYASAEKVDGKRLSGKLIPVDELLQILDKVKSNE